MRRNLKWFFLLCGLVTFLLIVGMFWLAGKVSAWFDSHTVEVRSPITVDVQTNKILSISERETIKPVVFSNQEELYALANNSPRPDIANYIIEKFGPTHGATALAVATAESGLREDAINLNGGHSLDVGIFQVNLKYHGHKVGCALKDLADPYRNVDCAYKIWQEQGWSPWVAYTNGSYLAHVSN